MMSTLSHPLVVDYLSRLERAAAGLTPDRRTELVGDIGEHIEEAVSSTDGSNDAIREVLDRLGPPEEIAAEADPSASPPPTARRPVLELVSLGSLVLGILCAVSVVLLLASPVFTVLGLVLALFSSRWGWQEKALAVLAYGVLGPVTLLAAGAAPAWVETCTTVADSAGVMTEQCTGGPPAWWPFLVWPALLAVVGLWVYTGVRLYRRAHA